jgi:hypothetical protein
VFFMRNETRLTPGVIRAFALCAFAVYIAWNVAWLARGHIPPSMLKGFVGIPCPTTGGCRSIQALCRGQLRQSFLFNPLTLVYLGLFAYSVSVLSWQRLRGMRLVLRPALAWAWWLSLLVGWAAKFALGKQYW